MSDHVRYEGMIHWGRYVIIGFDGAHSSSAQELSVRFLCAKPLHPARSVEFSRADVDCMTCLVVRAREG